MTEGETWPRWLPGVSLHDRETHYVLQRGESGLCGASVMWAEPRHPTTTRPRCTECQKRVRQHQEPTVVLGRGLRRRRSTAAAKGGSTADAND